MSDNYGGFMQFEEFEIQIKDGLVNLFDFTVLETHPLTSTIKPSSADFSGSQGEFLRKSLLDTIESLKPLEKTYDVYSTEWRIYIVLLKRYVEGLSSTEVASLLSMSERQYRRYLKKGVQSVALILWDRFIQRKNSSTFESLTESITNNFNVMREQIELGDIVDGVTSLLANRFLEEQVEIQVSKELSTTLIESDRIILRQILIEIVNRLLNFKIQSLRFVITSSAGSNTLGIIANDWISSKNPLEPREESQENNIWFWSEKLGLQIEQKMNTAHKEAAIWIHFIQSEQKKILIIDDQEPAIRLFTRYLSRSNVKVFALSKPVKVLAKVKEMQPELILLDIMMPKMDGWEVLQSLKLDQETKQIPVIVCSAWGEPELAKSLGAVEFLRKPVTQRDLLATIQAIGVFN